LQQRGVSVDNDVRRICESGGTTKKHPDLTCRRVSARAEATGSDGEIRVAVAVDVAGARDGVAEEVLKGRSSNSGRCS
jgi:hypothetical protein